jgi:tubulin polyglutamylase TTLL1/tubulin monoglycylase TTLL3/8
MNNIDIFSFFPLTIILNLEDENLFNYNFKNFKTFYKNIYNYIDTNKNIKTNNNINNYNNNKNKKTYAELFSICKDKYYNNGVYQPLIIPKSHILKNIWILKPSNLNRGREIILCDNLNKIEKEVNNIKKNKKFQYLLLQKYIENILLYNKRKFDIRIWVLLVFLNNKYNCFYFKEGHLKSSTENYNINDNNIYIHLTNYSIQKYNNNFSKYEIGNEISFKEFQNFLGEKINFKNKILPNIINIIKISINSVINKFNLINRNYCFEIFGYDFILDENYVPYLLEINTNPGLEISSPLISKLIPRMIDDCFRLTIDKIFERDEEEDEYKNKSPFKIEEYNDEENLWEKII